MVDRSALRAEVFGRAAQRAAEQFAPQPVAVHARDQWVVLPHEPARQREAIARGLGGQGGPERLRHVGGDRVAARVVGAADAQRRGRRHRRAMAQHQRAVDGRCVGSLLRGGELGSGCLAASEALGVGAQFGAALHLGGRRQFERDLVVGLEERDQPEELALRDRVVLVVVALRTLQRRTEPHGRGRRRAVEQPFPARFVGVDAALVVAHRVAVEAGRQHSLVAAIGQQVAGQLQQREAIERQVAVVGIDDPVAPLPHRARRIEVEAVGVGVAREVEPRQRPAFAVVRRREQAVDDALVGLWRCIGEERVEFGRRRRQPDQVERDAAQQRRAVGGLCRRQAVRRQLRHHERVDRMAVGGRLLSARCRVGPMRGGFWASAFLGHRQRGEQHEQHRRRIRPRARQRQVAIARPARTMRTARAWSRRSASAARSSARSRGSADAAVPPPPPAASRTGRRSIPG